MDIKYCIWDFNGTILDDVWAGIDSVNILLSERGLKTLGSREDYYKVFHFPIIDYYRALGFDFDKEPYEVLAPIWVGHYLEKVKDAKIFPDVLFALDCLKQRGIVQSVISATEEEMLKGQLAGLGISDYFEDILGLDNIHAGSKLDIARKWRESHKGRAILIGDTDHDTETAAVLGAECLLVARGHQSREHLMKNTSARVFEDLYEVLKYITKEIG